MGAIVPFPRAVLPAAPAVPTSMPEAEASSAHPSPATLSSPNPSAPRIRIGWALAAVLAATLLVVAVARLTGVDPRQRPDAAATARLALLFDDRADGAVLIRDAQSGAVLRELAPGTQGFVRSTLRGLARERKRQGADQRTPFELIARADGRLTLLDPTTGRRVDLEAFGPANAAPFVELLPASPARTQAAESALPPPPPATAAHPTAGGPRS